MEQLDLKQDPVFSDKEDEETFKNQEELQFKDGDGALGFRTPGDKLILGPDSIHKYARQFELVNGGDMAIIKTESGNHYSIAGGLIIKEDSGSYFELPKDNIEVTIGKPFSVPELGISSTEVKNVMLHYYKANSETATKIDVSSPFVELQKQVAKITRGLRP